MAETVNDLYLKYVNSVGASLEDDRYFRYLFELVQAGSNVLSQNRKVLHKVVDESWLSMIEDSLDAINNIIDKPRRFIETSEEVVPVELAKKITADSVRHLSQNTQFIVYSEDGNIQPTRILNVTTEESYNLYENRFVYWLIQKLVSFIDKRTDIIFWSTGDEICNTMSLESKIDDAYEEIEYKLEMKVKNRQSFAENDADNMDTFMRIDRVRRLTMALRGSSFCQIMNGCSKVRSPIQRTNLMMKDPNYRKCYNLWQFLERYDSVGYTIEERDTAMEFDEEYLVQLYTNLIGNYAIFKSLSEEEPRELDDAVLSSRQILEPKFVKEIHEEIVDDYNIPDVEIRQVIIEEVTQAQLDAEAKAAEELALRLKAEEELAKAELTVNEALRQSQEAMQLMLDAQSEAAKAYELQKKAEEEALDAQSEKVISQKAQKAAEEARNKAEYARVQAVQEREAALRAKEDAVRSLRLAQEQTSKAIEARNDAVAHAQSLEAALKNTQALYEQAKTELENTRAELKTWQSDCEKQRMLKEEALENVRRLRDEMQEALRQKSDADNKRMQAENAKRECEAMWNTTKAELENTASQLQRSRQSGEKLQKELDEAVQRANKAVSARREAERLRAKAENTMLEADRAAEQTRRELAVSTEKERTATTAAEQLRRELEALRTELAAGREENSRLSASLGQMAEKYEKTSAALTDTQEKLTRTAKKLEEKRLFNKLSRVFSGDDSETPKV